MSDTCHACGSTDLRKVRLRPQPYDNRTGEPVTAEAREYSTCGDCRATTPPGWESFDRDRRDGVMRAL